MNWTGVEKAQGLFHNSNVKTLGRQSAGIYIIPEISCARKEIGIIAPKPVIVIQIVVRQLNRSNTTSILAYVYPHKKINRA